MITHKKRILAASAACAVGLGLLTVPATAVAAEGDEALVNVIAFNDFHGRIEAPNRDGLGGTVAFAATIEQLRAQHGDANSLVLSGGDNIGASLYASSSQQDTPTLDVLNALEIDASTVGNHEFDRGVADLQGRVRDGSDFPHLAANVTLDGAPIGPAYELFEVDGITVGVIGAVTEETPALVDRGGIEGVEFGDPVEAVNAVAAALSDGDAANGEADLILASYHEGAQVSLKANDPQETQAAALQTAMSTSPTFRSIVEDTAPEVDAILNGHTHNLYSWLAPAPEGSQQDVRPILQSSSYGAHLGQLVARVDRATGVATFDTVRNVARTTLPSSQLDAISPRVGAVRTITDAALAEAKVLGGVPLGDITGDITTAVKPGGDRDDRANASTMGTLVANMLRDQLSSEARGGAEIGITNPGGLRAELYYAAGEGESRDGVVTVGEAAAVLPFANNLWTADVTGAQLKVILEQQWQRDASGGVPSAAYLQLGLSDNVEYTYDSTLPEGSRITAIWIDGERFGADDVVRVAAPSFLINGGDNFRGFNDATAKSDSGLVDSAEFEAYIRAQTPLSPDFSRRQLDVVGVPTAPVAVGSEVSLTVNKVDLTSRGTPVSTEIELWHGGERLATAPVEAGSATVVFDAPLAVGSARLELRTASGTAVPVALPVDLATDRTGGADRYEVAVALSAQAYAGGAGTVYVASGEVWTDALTAGPAAAHEGAPLLLVQKGQAPANVLAEIERLGAERVVVVGGEATISASTAGAIDALDGVTVERVAGADRWETSRLVAEHAFGSADGAYVASGLGFSDALSAGAAAGHLDQPLVLVNPTASLDAELVESLDGIGVQRVRVAGGPATIPSSLLGELVDAGFTVGRIGGEDRFAVSAGITASAFDAPVSHAYLASGLVFPDALAGAAVAGAQDVPLMIVREGCVPQRTLDQLERLEVSEIRLVGGLATLGEDVAALVACS